MKQPTRQERLDIRIRAARAWSPERGREAADLPLSAADKAELVRLAEVIAYRTARSQIVVQGQAAGFLYLLTDGVVEADCTVNDGARQVLAFYWPGDLFGLAEDGVYVHSAAAVTPCTVYRFAVRRLEPFLLEHPRVQHNFLIKAVHELRSAQRRIITLGRFGVVQRLAIFLLDCSGHEHYFDQDSHVLTLPMTRYDIADYLGTSAESATRAFGELERRGLIRRLTARAVELKSAELEAFADFD
jgi:CRP-like cAMP-binding protein